MLSGRFLILRLALHQIAPNCPKYFKKCPKLSKTKLSFFVQERLPLFDCDTFEVLREREGFTVVVLLR